MLIYVNIYGKGVTALSGGLNGGAPACGSASEPGKEKTLYISDLDGTLLGADVRISDFTRDTLNRLIRGGLHFTVATARTDATVKRLLEGLEINVPVVLMNGAALYDLERGEHVSTESISPEGKRILLTAARDNGGAGFVYRVEDGELTTYYENTSTPNAAAFIEERVTKFGKRFVRTDSLLDSLDGNVIYFSISNKKEKLDPLRRRLGACGELNIEYYRDVYAQDFWYLEVSAPTASKYNAVNALGEIYGFSRKVCFGDNLNDIPMFRACDRALAVANAKPEVVSAADAVIGANTADGVAKYLESL